MTVMLLSRQTFVSSRMGSWCSDWGELKRMSETRKSREVAAHDVTHEEKYAEVVRVA